ncbi:hypothetical protein Nepgr_032194 [Nepenthes gracilis]|uniref:Glyoxysomal processing protease, glyoxysomal n=1 Tax=Nepenthes gracilis TaxID=150966 RepID=A0AAD3TJV4_NEPGR|nr:hypothetical protein Nepgr_032194 [Nepenthes gracilis]
MELPEIADFARNFAVMVRIKGPDPKGLKMRNHAFHQYHSGRTTLSASGMLLPENILNNLKLLNSKNCVNLTPNCAVVVTVASIIEPFLTMESKAADSQALAELIPYAEIDIMVEGKVGAKCHLEQMDKDASQWFHAEILRLVDVPASSFAIQLLIGGSSGSLEHIWEVGWSLASHVDSPQKFLDAMQKEGKEASSTESKRPLAMAEASGPNLMGKATARIAFLQVPLLLNKDLPMIMVSPCCKRGDALLAMGSPFGILSPVHFFNSIALGSVSNFYPPTSSDRSLLMADIRCLPGMEGSPVFGEAAQLIGWLTRPLRQIGGAEIQLVIPWQAVEAVYCNMNQRTPQFVDNLNTRRMTVAIDNHTPSSNIIMKQLTRRRPPSAVEISMASICLVTVGNGVWASGVLLNQHGMILTNAHLFEPWRFGRATLHSGRNGAVVEKVFIPLEDSVAPEGSGTFQKTELESVPHRLCPINTELACPSPGSKAFVIGHGLFGPRCDLFPSISSGVIAKVVKTKMPLPSSSSMGNTHGEFPVMIETTAAVHPGGSGGAVVNSAGHMIGLVTSNVKHGRGTIIPHLNFSIPCAALEPIFKFSKDMQNISLLQELENPNQRISSVWELMPPPLPDPGSTLPGVDNLLKDNERQQKGSRFAKFMAERQDLLKGSSQPTTAPDLSSDTGRSKL